MKRTLAALGVVAALGAATATAGPYMTGTTWGHQEENADGLRWGARYAPSVPNMQGPNGQPVPMVAPYNASPPSGADVARAMLQQSMPMSLLQQAGYGMPGGMSGGMSGGMPPGMPGAGLMQMGGPMPPGMPPMAGIAPPGVPLAPGMPPAPKPPPGNYPIPPGAVNAMGAIITPPASPFPVQRTEVKFVGPAGMKISWFAPSPDGKAGFSTQYLEAPGRYNFLQASFYRLKLYDIPNRPGVTLYPTLEVVPSKAKTCAFLAHSAVPVVFTEDDFEQVAAGNYVVKVIYLPDPQFQDLAATAPDEVVSTRLEPGMDPIVEAQRRGCILLVVRLGNIDLEAPNTPSMDAPNPFAPPPPAVPVPAAPAPGAPAAPAMPPGAPGQLPPVPAQPTGPQQLPPGAMPPGAVPPGAVPQGGGFPGGGPGTPLGFLPPPPTLQQAAGRQTGRGR